ncbi:MAG: hypothetical protein GEU78_18740 [Actinobacteria bacterium]|nr:hypothetical protein [Actinomycetota bacterium]
MPAVTRASRTGDPAVAGVVLSGFDPQAAALDPADAGQTAAADATPDGVVRPGSYLLVTVFGPARVNATAEVATLRPGTLLTTGARPGYAAGLADSTSGGGNADVSGASLGKMLGKKDDRTGQVWVFVSTR